jgi:ATP-dependent helicase/nuclease subunit A
MSAMNRRISQLSLFGDGDTIDEPVDVPTVEVPAAKRVGDPDVDARAFAVDPGNNVVLEASAGTGKTSVLVSRYVNLLKAGVDPANILAITFTRKAAAEMRERIVRELRDAAGRSEIDRARWIDLRDRLADIAITTIDAFCLSLLREFPLEADVDPGFDMADETEVPRLVEESLDRSLRIITSRARTDADIGLVLAQLGMARTREGLAVLLERRLVAWDALERFLMRGPSDLTAAIVCRRTATSLQDVLRSAPGGLPAFLAAGPVRHGRYQLLLRELERHLPGVTAGVAFRERAAAGVDTVTDASIRGLIDRVANHFLTQDGTARKSGAIYPYRADDYPTPDAAKRHRSAVFQIAPHIERVVFSFTRDLNALLARGIRRMFAISLEQYRRALEERSVLDFSDVLEKALSLLRQMDEFAQSRFRLESRYHHVLVDEFQDTSRAQWELISLLIQSWGEGAGLATRPSIFIVGDRKQSIYRFRDAEVTVLHEAARHIEALRPAGNPRRSIARSFRAVPELLNFVNDLFAEIAPQPATEPDDFTYGEADRFPPIDTPGVHHEPALGISVADDPDECAVAVAAEIERILRDDSVRDRQTGVARRARPGDIAILFRSRTSHREFERELERRAIPSYVYKGLGFFDADETKDVTALLRYLARPSSNLRAAAFLRSRFLRLSDPGLAQLAPDLAAALIGPLPPAAEALTDEDRRVLLQAREYIPRWLDDADRVRPAELVESILEQTAYAYELRGPRRLQAWENLKKMRGLVRRIQNRGYATLTRIADHIDALTGGDESNAVLEALDAVNLMTVHASKGLEFPIVFVVNMAKGASGPPKPIRVIVRGENETSVSVGPFVSEMDEANRERERHETRRLLYVAVTRARDRLYLSSALKDGVLAPGRGSLAEVLPPSIAALFSRAASTFPECPVVSWTSSSGRPYEWRLCRVPAAAVLEHEKRPLPDKAAGTVPAKVQATYERTVTASSGVAAAEEALTGTLVHRLFASGVDSDGDALEARARRLLAPEERAAVADPDRCIRRASDVWSRLRSRPDVAELLVMAVRHHEVPFSIQDGHHVVRGAIDCLVRKPDGGMLVIEFKTGAPQPAHRAQLDAYVRAATCMFPGVHVEGRLIYP